ncbi:MAG: glycine zipper 2TM domain-containing protein [Herminiimonas sp.]|nr:glycine zipper 2TM domain-containing protein [Herminiimonas sp.]
MNSRSFTAGAFALMTLLPLAGPVGSAHAQQSNNYNTAAAGPRIDGFNVDEVRRLVPGAELNFNIYGSPGGTATLRINGAQRNLTLSEVEPGQYAGTYTISSRDRITANSGVTGNLRVGNQVASTVLSESLVVGVGRHTPNQAPGPLPQISRFEVRASPDLGGGSELPFTLYGTPGGKADISIAGSSGRFFLPEVRSGEYSGTYTVRRSDRIASNSAVKANLQIGQRITTATLGKPLMLASAPPPVPREPRYCSSCGVVEAVNLIEVKGDGNYLGTIGGGVVGALLGSQVGNGNGRTAAEIAGALGGAYAGREVQKNTQKTAHYEVVVRLQNGGTQTVSFAGEPGFRIGEKVRITDGTLARDQ